MGKWDRWPDEKGFEDDDDFEDEDDEDDEDDYDEDEDDGFDLRWNYYSQHKPRKVAGGLKTKNTRGTIGETWWSKRWLSTLESFGMGTRLTRGRTYARQGQVLSIEVEPGLVKAKVQGSMPKPYTIKIELKPLSIQEWERVTAAMASQALFAAKLLAGEMPSNIEEAFSTVKLSLFPTRLNDLQTSCSCPDYANPCKHIAAVYYILAEQFDEDPFLIFKLRGRTKDELISALRAKRAELAPAPGASTETPASASTQPATIRLEDQLSTFWRAGEELEQFTVKPQPPDVDKAILKRLGNAPFNVGKQNLTALLEQVYDAVSNKIAHTDIEE